MASVRKRNKNDPNSPWVVDYTDNEGKRHLYTPKTGLKKDADAARRRIEGELEQDSHTAKSQTKTIAELSVIYERYLEDRYKVGTIARGTLDNQKCHLRYSIVPVLGKRKLAELTVEDVDKLTSHMLKRGLARSSIIERRNTLRRLENWANRRGYTKKNVAQTAIRLNPIRRDDQLQVPTKVEALRILQASEQSTFRCHKRSRKADALTVMLGMLCGLRYGEIVGLRLQDYDPIGRKIHVRMQYTKYGEHKAPKTRAGIRTIPVPIPVCNALDHWIENHYVPNEGNRLISSRDGGERANANWRRTWAIILKRAGCYVEGDPMHFHAARHFAGSLWLEKGVPLAVVSRLLGHASPNVTLAVYTHVLQSIEETTEALDAISASLLNGGDATRLQLTALSS